jgi:hypothetical protein
MSDVCHKVDISRWPGHKILSRYKGEDVTAITDRSLPPSLRQPTAAQLSSIMVGPKKDRPHWAARYLRELLLRRLLKDIRPRGFERKSPCFGLTAPSESETFRLSIGEWTWGLGIVSNRIVEYELPQGGIIQIETSETAASDAAIGNRPVSRNVGDTARASFEAALAQVKPGVEAMVAQFRNLASKPDEVGLEFGIKFIAGTDALIAKSSLEGNIKVTLSWKSKP